MGILEQMRLDGKVAVVTGGARGIGLAIARALAQAGAKVALADLDLAQAQKSATDIEEETQRQTLAVQADVTDPAQVEAMLETVAGALGEVDIAFCNAGICINQPAESMSYENFKKVMDINLGGVFLTATAAARRMMKAGKGGSIVNTASMSAHIVNQPQPQCAYNASKAGVIQLTKSLAVEWAGKNIRVNSISPGYIGTELTLESPTLRPLIDQWNAAGPLHRLGKPEELASLAVYLAGDTSSFTTGADFVVDGAFTCV